MALLPAFAIDGGRVPASMLRMFAWVATNGAEGVVTFDDFKVQALPTPGSNVSINAGGAVIPTRFGNATSQQSYIVANDQAFNLPIAAAGAAGRTEFVILRTMDPQYSGQVPSDPENALYCEVTTVSSLPNTYPYIPLARIVLPANTSTITNSMITDLRKLAMPRRQMEVGFHYPTTWTEITSSTNQTIGSLTFNVPKWATHMKVKGDFASMAVQGGLIQGTLTIGAFGQDAQVSTYKTESNGPGSTQRYSTVVGGTWAVPSASRGGTVTITFKGRLTGSWNGGVSGYDSGTTLAALVEFEERAI